MPSGNLFRPLLCLLLMVVFYCSCNKETNTTNNFSATHRPAFTIQGLGDMILSLARPYAAMSFSVMFEDSVQEKVSLSVTGLPKGIAIGDYWVKSGYPTFKSQLYFYENDTLNPTLPGTYPVKLLATGTTSGTRSLSFNIIVDNDPLCTSGYTGAYPNCAITSSSVHFYDSMYNDANVNNKVWFTNFANTGKKVAGIFNCGNNGILIPYQKIDGDVLYGSGTTYLVALPYKFRFTVKVNEKSVNFQM